MRTGSLTFKPWRKLYNTKRWQALRTATFKRDMFICQMCNEPTKLTKDRRDRKAATCDHKIAHKGDEVLFFDLDNLQTVCKKCHDSTKQREEVQGYSDEIGLDGWPVDSNHPFNRGKVQ